MSILNRPSDGLFNVLIAIYKILAAYGPLSKEDIKKLVVPGDISDDHYSNTLNRWRQFGLFREEDKVFSVESEYAPKEGESLDETITRLPIVIRSLIFKKENNANFWDSAKSASADFTRGMAWLLAQDIYSFATNSHAAVEEVESRQLAEASKRLFANDTRWIGLCHWAPYLGFAWGGTNLVIDPTVALRESLPQVFSDAKSITASTFLESLAEILPVLDFGTYRQAVEKVLNSSNWSKPPKFSLSTSLSRAIKRLELSNELTLEYRSDTGQAYRCLRQNKAEWGRAFTHVTWNCEEGK